eukprot:TRINITY_DN10396_c0_g1_i1.p1 TRINITY_DN10396_c0_g1~~TRINITY_DN10396_c0_g1_i1.p1  ORF type:complete len:475 (+),score=154.86 TRINITY_DN10396_c0_g1_i1:29-1426(+)
MSDDEKVKGSGRDWLDNCLEIDEKEFAQRCLEVLTGNAPLPYSSSDENKKVIADRSVLPQGCKGSEGRLLAVEFLETVIQRLWIVNEQSVFIDRQNFTETLTIPVESARKIGVKQSSPYQEFEIGYVNLMVTLFSPNAQESSKFVVFGSHYDVQNNASECWREKNNAKEYRVTSGADDNGSGVIDRQNFTESLTIPVESARKIGVKQSSPYQEFEIGYVNLMVTLFSPNAQESSKFVVFGSHYDVQNNASECWREKNNAKEYRVTSGADDNGSGVVGLLMLLRRIAKFGVDQLDCNLIVVFFDGEEPGAANEMCVGSNYFVKNALKFLNEKFHSAFQFQLGVSVDMIGVVNDPDVGMVISVNKFLDCEALENRLWGKPKSLVQVDDEDFEVTIATERMQTVNAVWLTDSNPFCKVKVPAFALCDVPALNALPAYYHTCDDTMALINYDFMIFNVDLLVRLIKPNA